MTPLLVIGARLTDFDPEEVITAEVRGPAITGARETPPY